MTPLEILLSGKKTEVEEFELVIQFDLLPDEGWSTFTIKASFWFALEQILRDECRVGGMGKVLKDE